MLSEIISICVLLVFILKINFIQRSLNDFLACYFATSFKDCFCERVHKTFNSFELKLFNNLKENLKVVDGEILDIGSGCGAILQNIPKNSSLIAVEPCPYMRKYLKAEVEKFPDIKVKIIAGFAEDLSEIESESIAAVTCVLSLCSVQDQMKVLKEIKRVLKPGGIFCFLEHVKAPGPIKSKLQMIVNGPRKLLRGGCNLTCETSKVIEEACFKDLQYSSATCPNGTYLIRDIIVGKAFK